MARRSRRSSRRPLSVPKAIQSAGSLLFYAGRYYTQIVSTQDDAKFAAFALELAKRVANRQKPGGASARRRKPRVQSRQSRRMPKTARPAASTRTRQTHRLSRNGRRTGLKATANQPLNPPKCHLRPLCLLPSKDRQGDAKYVAQDVFGYSFFSDVFMADYKTGDATWQGFLRPYRNSEEAKAVLEKYVDGVKKDGAEVKKLAVQGADEMVKSDNIGLTDFVFRKGNTLAGANGATSAAPAEAFTRDLAKTLPAAVPTLDSAN